MLTVLFFSIILGIMAFLPRPVESSGDEDFPPSPASFTSGSPFDGRPPSFHSFDPRMRQFPYDDKSEFLDESLSPARTLALVNGAPQEPPRLWQSFQTRNSTDDPIYAQTIITRTYSPMKPVGVDVKSGRQKTDSLYLNPFSAPSTPPLPVYTPASETGNESPSVSPSMPSQLPTVPELMYGARADSMHHDRAAPYTPTIYTDPIAHSLPATFRGSHQPRHMYPDPVQTAVPRVSSFHSSTASVHSKWAVSPSHVLPPPVLTPSVAHSNHPSGFFHLQDLPSTYHAQDTTLKRNVSVPNMNHGGGLARQSYTLPVAESSLQRRGSDGQVVDQAQWRGVVLGAVAKP